MALGDKSPGASPEMAQMCPFQPRCILHLQMADISQGFETCSSWHREAGQRALLAGWLSFFFFFLVASWVSYFPSLCVPWVPAQCLWDVYCSLHWFLGGQVRSGPRWRARWRRG